ncbi:MULTISPECIES: hypothetical protein [Bacillus]|uniref:hypothetical protein n=1 Tax=Bacillus TaxID=1386 RepID=UPI0015862586|nr:MULTISPECIES: hypothetical protein [Bacillus]
MAVILLCEIAGVSRAAYYKWLQRTPTARELENEATPLYDRSLDLATPHVVGYVP